MALTRRSAALYLLVAVAAALVLGQRVQMVGRVVAAVMPWVQILVLVESQ
jgi:hypothetical protein